MSGRMKSAVAPDRTAPPESLVVGLVCRTKQLAGTETAEGTGPCAVLQPICHEQVTEEF